MKEYDIYVPLFTNDGVRIPANRLARLKHRLVKRFGGLTYFPQRSEGFWKVNQVTFRDEIVILRVLTDDTAAVRQFWKRVQRDLKRTWRQDNVLIVIRDVQMV